MIKTVNIHCISILLIVSTTLLSGCYTITARKEFKNKIKTCYTGEKTNRLNNIFDNLGYFTLYVKGNFSSGEPNTKDYIEYDSLPINIMFFNDGIYLQNFYLHDKHADDMQYYFNNIYGTEEDEENFWQNSFWGSYMLWGDTVRTQFFFIGSLNAGWYGVEEWYKIIDRKTLKSIYRRPIGTSVTSEQLETYWKNDDRYTQAEFVPLNRMPSSDCWLKKEKWYWCDENNWREYMNANGYKIKRKDRIKKND